MGKVLIIVLILALATVCVNAERLNSTVDGGVIRTLPKVGQIVKAGEILVTCYCQCIDMEIDTLKIEIEEAKELLKNRNLDKERAEKLVGKAMSKSDWEGAAFNAISAKLDVKIKETKLRELEVKRTLRFIPAPCDCKVTKIYLIENSGTFAGQGILEVERLN